MNRASARTSDGRINVLATAAPENEPAAPAQGANLEQPAGSPAREREIPGAGGAGNRDAPAEAAAGLAQFRNAESFRNRAAATAVERDARLGRQGVPEKERPGAREGLARFGRFGARAIRSAPTTARLRGPVRQARYCRYCSVPAVSYTRATGVRPRKARKTAILDFELGCCRRFANKAENAFKVDEEIRLAVDRREGVEYHDPFDDKRGRVIDQSRVDAAPQVFRSPSKGVAAPNHVKIKVDRWCSELPRKPRGERRFADAAGAINRDQQRQAIRPKAPLHLFKQCDGPRKRLFNHHSLRHLLANAA